MLEVKIIWYRKEQKYFFILYVGKVQTRLLKSRIPSFSHSKMWGRETRFPVDERSFVQK